MHYYFSNVAKAYLIGKASADFAKVLLKYSVPFVEAGDLQEAVKIAWQDIKNQQNFTEKNLLLSPACASFDQWQNFEKRGEAFCDIVLKLNSAL